VRFPPTREKYRQIMTTIAYRDGVLAADTMASVGDTKIPGRAKKVWKFSDGRLFSGAGRMEEIRKLQKLIARHIEGPLPCPVSKECEAILIMPNGAVLIYEGKVWSPEADTPYHALGSGFVPALTAMWLGHDAITAVKAGIHFDKGSGGSVQHVTLDQIQKGKRSAKAV
jgi:hypothetical protein